MKPVTLVLPYPPSTNKYWRSIVIGTRAQYYVSDEGKAFIQEVAIACMRQRAPRGLTSQLAVAIEVREPATDKNGKKLGVKRDLDNVLKATLDALRAPVKKKDKHYGVYLDDRQIDDLHVTRGERKGKGELVVTITRLTQPDLVEQAT